jgi:hypothetical protein
LELTKEKEDRQRLILNVIQLQNSTTRSSTALELAHVLCHLYGINPSIVAENWAARMLKLHQAAAVDGVLRKIKPYDSVDYVRLAVAAKKYAIENSEVNKIVKCARDPKVRMIYILTELGNDVEAMQDVLQSMDGNALVSYLVLCKYKLPAETFGLRLAQNTIIADQYAAYRQYIQYASILQIEGYPPLRAAALELLHSGDIAFGKDTQRLSEVARRLEQVEKKSPLLLAVQHQQTVIGAMQAVTSGQGFSPKPATSARFLVMQALMDGRGSLVDSLLKPYKVSDKTFAWIQIQTFSAKKDWKRFADLAKKSSPLSWDVYSDVCHANGRREEAVAFVRKISSAEQRLALFEQYEYWREAAGAASELKSPRWAELNAKAKAEDDND